ncbi:uncharacterized protein LOC106868313 [Octopus bimaculoides]|uniref:uncharacterized protein LOC106868313 n=1 Tax=Octopus bimaculoides TaxID=37653 RepID=UPI00071CD506|nr:uncharacterized protein LOC106868313 [Octopus bimaculoides]|eukprot:XP_014768989.1 PREDICTED: uncharacterized protein LOC106868313 [Octopus bimaculoides]
MEEKRVALLKYKHQTRATLQALRSGRNSMRKIEGVQMTTGYNYAQISNCRLTQAIFVECMRLQEKCREQRQPFFITFIDLTKAVDIVSTHGLFRILAKVGCPPRLLSIVQSFHTDMKGVVQIDDSFSEAFNIRSGEKRGCVLSPILFGIFFAVMLKHALGKSTDGVYLHTRSSGILFRLSRLKTKSEVRQNFVRGMLFADDAALTAHSEE